MNVDRDNMVYVMYRLNRDLEGDTELILGKVNGLYYYKKSPTV